MPFLIWSSARYLLFAFLLTFFSSFGQTFFIGLFSADLQAHLGLDYGSFGSVYGAATLLSAFIILWAGALIDRLRIGVYVGGVTALYVLGCVLLSQISDLFMLAVAFFLLRFSGQGLFSHIAVTLTAKTFESTRGRALSISFLGHPTGEAVLPPLFVFLGEIWSWQDLWLGNALALACLLPILLVLLGRPAEQRARRKTTDRSAERATVLTGKNRAEVLRDPMFHQLLPALLLPGFLATGIFIHQSALILEKGWTGSWFALSFSFFAAGQVAGNLIGGHLVDRLGARRLMSVYLLPMAMVAALTTMGDHPLLAPLLMAGTGLTTGSASPVTNSMWAESYGLKYLGSIRALAASILVISSALSPALFGYFLEANIAFDKILIACAVASGGAALLAHHATRNPQLS